MASQTMNTEAKAAIERVRSTIGTIYIPIERDLVTVCNAAEEEESRAEHAEAYLRYSPFTLSRAVKTSEEMVERGEAD